MKLTRISRFIKRLAVALVLPVICAIGALSGSQQVERITEIRKAATMKSFMEDAGYTIKRFTIVNNADKPVRIFGVDKDSSNNQTIKPYTDFAISMGDNGSTKFDTTCSSTNTSSCTSTYYLDTDNSYWYNNVATANEKTVVGSNGTTNSGLGYSTFVADIIVKPFWTYDQGSGQWVEDYFFPLARFLSPHHDRDTALTLSSWWLSSSNSFGYYGSSLNAVGSDGIIYLPMGFANERSDGTFNRGVRLNPEYSTTSNGETTVNSAYEWTYALPFAKNGDITTPYVYETNTTEKGFLKTNWTGTMNYGGSTLPSASYLTVLNTWYNYSYNGGEALKQYRRLSVGYKAKQAATYAEYDAYEGNGLLLSGVLDPNNPLNQDADNTNNVYVLGPSIGSQLQLFINEKHTYNTKAPVFDADSFSLYDVYRTTYTTGAADQPKKLTYGTDYTVSLEQGTHTGWTAASDYVLKVHLNASDFYEAQDILYKPETNITYPNSNFNRDAFFTIDKLNLANATIQLSQSTYTYDGNAKVPTVTVKNGNDVIPQTVNGVANYTITYSNNTNPGTATVTVTGASAGSCVSGSVKTATFTINKLDISDKVTLNYDSTSLTYNGQIQSPINSVSYYDPDKPNTQYNGKDLPSQFITTRYTGSSGTPLNVGNYTATLTFQSSFTYYTFTAQLQFSINKFDITGAQVSFSQALTYNNRSQHPTTTSMSIVKDGLTIPTNQFDFTWPTTSINAGTYNYTAVLKSTSTNFTGSLTGLQYTINKANLTLTSANVTFSKTSMKAFGDSITVTVKDAYGNDLVIDIRSNTDTNLLFATYFDLQTDRKTITPKHLKVTNLPFEIYCQTSRNPNYNTSNYYSTSLSVTFDEGNDNGFSYLHSNEKVYYYETFEEVYNLVAAGGTIMVYGNNVITSPITLNKNVNISGSTTSSGSNASITTTNSSSVFNINAGVSATISFLDIKNTGTANNGNSLINVNGGTLDLMLSSVSGGKGANGGAIDVNNGGTVKISDSQFTNNQASGDGGAIYVEDGDVTVITSMNVAGISPSSFTNNSAGGDGGAIAIESGTVSISGFSTSDTIISGNTAGDSGGAIYVSSTDPNSKVTIDKTTISNNTAATAGGAIFTSAGTVEIKNNSTISNNEASGGGAIHMNDSTLTITSSTIDGNEATSTNTAIGRGGAISLTNSDATITNATISNNSAKSTGGAITTIGESNVTVTGSTFEGNTATTGGAIYIPDEVSGVSGTLTVNNSDFNNNTATENGGAIYLGSNLNEEVTISNTDFDGNKAETGSDIYVGDGTNVKVTTVTIANSKDNETSGEVSSIFVGKDSTLTVAGASTSATGLTMTNSADYNAVIKVDDDGLVNFATNNNGVSVAINPVDTAGQLNKTFITIESNVSLSAGQKQQLVSTADIDRYYKIEDGNIIYADASKSVAKIQTSTGDYIEFDSIQEAIDYAVLHSIITIHLISKEGNPIVLDSTVNIDPKTAGILINSFVRNLVNGVVTDTIATVDHSVTIKRAAGFTGSFFVITDSTGSKNAVVFYGCIIMDGGANFGSGMVVNANGTTNNTGMSSVAPIVVNDGGTLGIQNGVTLQNNENTSTTNYGGGLSTINAGITTCLNGIIILNCYSHKGGAIYVGECGANGYNSYVQIGNKAINGSEDKTETSLISGNGALQGSAFYTTECSTVDSKYTDFYSFHIAATLITKNVGPVGGSLIYVQTTSRFALYRVTFGDNNGLTTFYLESDNGSESNEYTKTTLGFLETTSNTEPVTIDMSDKTGSNLPKVFFLSLGSYDFPATTKIVYLVTADQKYGKIAEYSTQTTSSSIVDNMSVSIKDTTNTLVGTNVYYDTSGNIYYTGYNLNVTQTESNKLDIKGTAAPYATDIRLTLSYTDSKGTTRTQVFPLTSNYGVINQQIDLSSLDATTFTPSISYRESSTFTNDYSDTQLNVFKYDISTGYIEAPNGTYYINNAGEEVYISTKATMPNDFVIDSLGYAEIYVAGSETPTKIYVGTRTNAPSASNDNKGDVTELNDTSITISTLDTLEYALVDKDGNIVTEWITGNATSGVTFTGLTEGTEYKVVTRTPSTTTRGPSTYIELDDAHLDVVKTLTSAEQALKDDYDNKYNTVKDGLYTTDTNGNIIAPTASATDLAAAVEAFDKLPESLKSLPEYKDVIDALVISSSIAKVEEFYNQNSFTEDSFYPSSTNNTTNTYEEYIKQYQDALKNLTTITDRTEASKAADAAILAMDAIKTKEEYIAEAKAEALKVYEDTLAKLDATDTDSRTVLNQEYQSILTAIDGATDMDDLNTKLENGIDQLETNVANSQGIVWKQNNQTILDKDVSAITSSDITAILDAINSYDSLLDATKVSCVNQLIDLLNKLEAAIDNYAGTDGTEEYKALAAELKKQFTDIKDSVSATTIPTNLGETLPLLVEQSKGKLDIQKYYDNLLAAHSSEMDEDGFDGLEATRDLFLDTIDKETNAGVIASHITLGELELDKSAAKGILTKKYNEIKANPGIDEDQFDDINSQYNYYINLINGLLNQSSGPLAYTYAAEGRRWLILVEGEAILNSYIEDDESTAIKNIISNAIVSLESVNLPLTEEEVQAAVDAIVNPAKLAVDKQRAKETLQNNQSTILTSLNASNTYSSELQQYVQNETSAAIGKIDSATSLEEITRILSSDIASINGYVSTQQGAKWEENHATIINTPIDQITSSDLTAILDAIKTFDKVISETKVKEKDVINGLLDKLNKAYKDKINEDLANLTTEPSTSLTDLMGEIETRFDTIINNAKNAETVPDNLSTILELPYDIAKFQIEVQQLYDETYATYSDDMDSTSKNNMNDKLTEVLADLLAASEYSVAFNRAYTGKTAIEKLAANGTITKIYNEIRGNTEIDQDKFGGINEIYITAINSNNSSGTTSDAAFANAKECIIELREYEATAILYSYLNDDDTQESRELVISADKSILAFGTSGDITTLQPEIDGVVRDTILAIEKNRAVTKIGDARDEIIDALGDSVLPELISQIRSDCQELINNINNATDLDDVATKLSEGLAEVETIAATAQKTLWLEDDAYSAIFSRPESQVTQGDIAIIKAAIQAYDKLLPATKEICKDEILGLLNKLNIASKDVLDFYISSGSNSAAVNSIIADAKQEFDDLYNNIVNGDSIPSSLDTLFDLPIDITKAQVDAQKYYEQLISTNGQDIDFDSSNTLTNNIEGYLEAIKEETSSVNVASKLEEIKLDMDKIITSGIITKYYQDIVASSASKMDRDSVGELGEKAGELLQYIEDNFNSSTADQVIADAKLELDNIAATGIVKNEFDAITSNASDNGIDTEGSEFAAIKEAYETAIGNINTANNSEDKYNLADIALSTLAKEEAKAILNSYLTATEVEDIKTIVSNANKDIDELSYSGEELKAAIEKIVADTKLVVEKERAFDEIEALKEEIKQNLIAADTNTQGAQAALENSTSEAIQNITNATSIEDVESVLSAELGKVETQVGIAQGDAWQEKYGEIVSKPIENITKDDITNIIAALESLDLLLDEAKEDKKDVVYDLLDKLNEASKDEVLSTVPSTPSQEMSELVQEINDRFDAIISDIKDEETIPSSLNDVLDLTTEIAKAQVEVQEYFDNIVTEHTSNMDTNSVDELESTIAQYQEELLGITDKEEINAKVEEMKVALDKIAATGIVTKEFDTIKANPEIDSDKFTAIDAIYSEIISELGLAETDSAEAYELVEAAIKDLIKAEGVAILNSYIEDSESSAIKNIVSGAATDIANVSSTLSSDEIQTAVDEIVDDAKLDVEKTRAVEQIQAEVEEIINIAGGTLTPEEITDLNTNAGILTESINGASTIEEVKTTLNDGLTNLSNAATEAQKDLWLSDTSYNEIFNKNIEDITSADINNIKKAIQAYDELLTATKAECKDEILSLVEKLAAASKDIIDEYVSGETISDGLQAIIDKINSDFDALSNGIKEEAIIPSALDTLFDLPIVIAEGKIDVQKYYENIIATEAENMDTASLTKLELELPGLIEKVDSATTIAGVSTIRNEITTQMDKIVVAGTVTKYHDDILNDNSSNMTTDSVDKLDNDLTAILEKIEESFTSADADTIISEAQLTLDRTSGKGIIDKKYEDIVAKAEANGMDSGSLSLIEYEYNDILDSIENSSNSAEAKQCVEEGLVRLVKKEAEAILNSYFEGSDGPAAQTILQNAIKDIGNMDPSTTPDLQKAIDDIVNETKFKIEIERAVDKIEEKRVEVNGNLANANTLTQDYETEFNVAVDAAIVAIREATSLEELESLLAEKLGELDDSATTFQGQSWEGKYTTIINKDISTITSEDIAAIKEAIANFDELLPGTREDKKDVVIELLEKLSVASKDEISDYINNATDSPSASLEDLQQAIEKEFDSIIASVKEDSTLQDYLSDLLDRSVRVGKAQVDVQLHYEEIYDKYSASMDSTSKNELNTALEDLLREITIAQGSSGPETSRDRAIIELDKIVATGMINNQYEDAKASTEIDDFTTIDNFYNAAITAINKGTESENILSNGEAGVTGLIKTESQAILNSYLEEDEVEDIKAIVTEANINITNIDGKLPADEVQTAADELVAEAKLNVEKARAVDEIEKEMETIIAAFGPDIDPALEQQIRTDTQATIDKINSAGSIENVKSELETGLVDVDNAASTAQKNLWLGDTTYNEIFTKPLDDITASDIDNIKAAIQAYDELLPSTKDICKNEILALVEKLNAASQDAIDNYVGSGETSAELDKVIQDIKDSFDAINDGIQSGATIPSSLDTIYDLPIAKAEGQIDVQKYYDVIVNDTLTDMDVNSQDDLANEIADALNEINEITDASTIANKISEVKISLDQIAATGIVTKVYDEILANSEANGINADGLKDLKDVYDAIIAEIKQNTLPPDIYAISTAALNTMIKEEGKAILSSYITESEATDIAQIVTAAIGSIDLLTSTGTDLQNEVNAIVATTKLSVEKERAIDEIIANATDEDYASSKASEIQDKYAGTSGTISNCDTIEEVKLELSKGNAELTIEHARDTSIAQVETDASVDKNGTAKVEAINKVADDALTALESADTVDSATSIGTNAASGAQDVLDSYDANEFKESHSTLFDKELTEITKDDLATIDAAIKDLKDNYYSGSQDLEKIEEVRSELLDMKIAAIEDLLSESKDGTKVDDVVQEYIDKINDLTYGTSAEVDNQISETLDSLIVEADKAIDYQEYKNEVIETIDKLHQDGESKEMNELIESFKEDVQDTPFDNDSSLQDLKDAIDAIYQTSVTEQVKQEVKDEAKETLNDLLESGDSQYVKEAIQAAEEKIQNLDDPNKAQIDAIIAEAKVEIAIERYKDDNPVTRTDFEDVAASDIQGIKDAISTLKDLPEDILDALDKKAQEAGYSAQVSLLEDMLNKAEFEEVKDEAVEEIESMVRGHDGTYVKDNVGLEVTGIKDEEKYEQCFDDDEREDYYNSTVENLATREEEAKASVELAQQVERSENSLTENLEIRIDSGIYTEEQKKELEKIIEEAKDNLYTYTKGDSVEETNNVKEEVAAYLAEVQAQLAAVPVATVGGDTSIIDPTTGTYKPDADKDKVYGTVTNEDGLKSDLVVDITVVDTSSKPVTDAIKNGNIAGNGTVEELKQILEDKIVATAIDVTLTENGQVVENESGKYTVSILLPEGVADRPGLQIVGMNSNGEVQVYETALSEDGKYLTFTADTLDTFYIMSDRVVNLNWLVIFLSILVAIEVGFAGILLYKRKKNKQIQNSTKASISVLPILAIITPSAGLPVTIVLGVTSLLLLGLIIYLFKTRIKMPPKVKKEAVVEEPVIHSLNETYQVKYEKVADYVVPTSIPKTNKPLKASSVPLEYKKAKEEEEEKEEYTSTPKEEATATTTTKASSKPKAEAKAATESTANTTEATTKPAAVTEEAVKEDKASEKKAAKVLVTGETVVATKAKEEKVENKPTEETGPKVKTLYRSESSLTISSYNRSYQAKLIQSDDDVKEYYDQIKNELMSYKGVKCRKSWGQETFRKGRKVLARIKVRGKTLCLYLNEDIKSVDTDKYLVEDVKGVSKYEDTPTLYRIKNNRRLKYSSDLISKVMEENTLIKKDTAHVDYKKELSYQETDDLVNEGLIKPILSKQKTQPVSVLQANSRYSDSEALSLIEESPLYYSKSGKTAIINVDTLAEYFKDGEVVTLQEIKKRVPRFDKNASTLRVLARSTLDKVLIIHADSYSLSAVKMITLLGGKAYKNKQGGK